MSDKSKSNSGSGIENVFVPLIEEVTASMTKGLESGFTSLSDFVKNGFKFNEKEIIIPEETIHHLIDTYCNKEDGVRNLKRCLEIIHTKLNLYRLMRPGSNLFEEDMALKVEFPFTVTKSIVDKLIKKDKEVSCALYSMYV